MGSNSSYERRKDSVMGLDFKITKIQIYGELAKPES